MNTLHTRYYWPLVLLLAACKSPQGPVPNSPTRDHEPPATSPGDGEVIGADRVPPAQKLEEGPKVDSEEGVVPANPAPPK